MNPHRVRTLVDHGADWVTNGKLIKLAFAVWALFVGGVILLAYRYYFPPDFQQGFLANRQQYFYGLYALGFYAHILTAPAVLVIGLLQTSRTLRRRYLRVHERLGQAYCVMILWAMAPGGLIIAFHAHSGLPAVLAFVLLSCLTWWFTYRGWICLRNWNTVEHGRWMQRSFILVCSAVLLRAFMAEARSWQLDSDISYAVIAWACWLPTWLTYELVVLWTSRRLVSGEVHR